MYFKQDFKMRRKKENIIINKIIEKLTIHLDLLEYDLLQQHQYDETMVECVVVGFEEAIKCVKEMQN